MAVDRTRSLPISTATAAALFLFLGCTGKSAQVPLYVWLPDAMAGPTPVSALIHAATMVTAGVYLIVRLSPVFVMSPVAMSVIALVGAFTALLAASIALVQNQMKKILAYSTVSQLGFMFAGVGVGAFAGGFFHVFTHAFFKACLFLGAGSVMHAVHAHGDADVRELGGLRKYMPLTHATFAISCLAIAGFPLTSGFFSKDEILVGAAFAGTGAWAEFPRWVGWTVFATLAIAAFMTAFYMFRMYFLAFWRDFRGGPKHEGHGDAHAQGHGDAHAEGHGDAHAEGHGGAHAVEPHESPWAMTLPLVVLGAGAALVGLLALPHWLGLPNVWEHWLAPVIGRVPLAEDAHVTGAIGGTAMAVGTLVGLGGIGLAYAWYAKPNDAPRKLMESAPKLHALLMDKWRVDELYGLLIVRPMEWLARFSANFDKLFVDTLLTKATSWAALAGGWLGTRAQTGVVQVYGAAIVLGTAVLTWWFLVPHPQLGHVVDGARVKLRAGAGLGYEYRFDVDSDGEYETRWTTDREIDGTYEPGDFRTGAVVVTTLRQGRKEVSYPLRGGRVLALDTSVVGPDWAADPAGTPVPATVDWQVPVRAIRIAWPERGSREGARTEADNLARQIRDGADAASIARERATDEASRASAGALETEDAADGEVTVGGRKVRVPDGQRVFVAEGRDGMYVVVLEDGHVALAANGAAVRIRGNDLTDGFVRLRPGEVAQVGSAIVRIGAVVRATAQVRNAFGYEVEETLDIVVQPPRPPAEGGAATADATGGAL